MEVFIKKRDNADSVKCAVYRAPLKSGGVREFVFNNGVRMLGENFQNNLEGSYRFEFPEGSVLDGRFEKGKMQSAEINYLGEVLVSGVYEQSPQTKESYLEQFNVVFKSGWQVRGSSNSLGTIERAEVMSPDNVVVSRKEDLSSSLVYELPNGYGKLEDSKRRYVVVSGLWVYEGGLRQDKMQGDTPVLDGAGFQVWTSGVGYHRSSIVEGKLKKDVFRFSRNLEVFREAVYDNGELLKSVSCYGNGLIFSTKGDFFSGEMIFVLRNNQVRAFPCQLSEYWSLKSGCLSLGAPGSEIKVPFENREDGLVFFMSESELGLKDFCSQLCHESSSKKY